MDHRTLRRSGRREPESYRRNPACGRFGPGGIGRGYSRDDDGIAGGEAGGLGEGVAGRKGISRIARTKNSESAICAIRKSRGSFQSLGVLLVKVVKKLPRERHVQASEGTHGCAAAGSAAPPGDQSATLVRRGRGNDELREGADDNAALQGEVPI